MKRIALALASLAAAALVFGCTGAPAEPVPSPAMTLNLAASGSRFDTEMLDVPPNTPFAIAFANADTVPHNIHIQGGPAPMVGEIFTGPAERTYAFTPLAPGTYRFICDVHPEMAGLLQVR